MCQTAPTVGKQFCFVCVIISLSQNFKKREHLSDILLVIIRTIGRAFYLVPLYFITRVLLRNRQNGSNPQNDIAFHRVVGHVVASENGLNARTIHTSAKLIEIQQNCLSKIHILHDLGSHMESNDTLHGSELVPHWVLGPKN